MKFSTYSGSEYEIVPGYLDPGSGIESPAMVRRVNPSYEKRADGEWTRLVNNPIIEVGQPVILTMTSLSEYGSDDYGTPEEDASPYTTRITSTVTEIEND